MKQTNKNHGYAITARIVHAHVVHGTTQSIRDTSMHVGAGIQI